MSDQKYYYGVGRRKASSARAKYFEAEELIISINKKDAKVYFPDYYYRTLTTMLSNIGIKQGKFDLFINGGGIMGQSDAARLALANAILAKDESYKPIIRQFGYNSTDNRKVLSKRPGKPKARKSRAWVKR